MTISEAVNKLTYEMILKTGHFEDSEVYKEYLNIAIVYGAENYGRNGRIGEEIIAMDLEGKEVGRYKDAYEASRKLGVAHGNITQILSGKKHSIHGYQFIRAKDKKV